MHLLGERRGIGVLARKTRRVLPGRAGVGGWEEWILSSGEEERMYFIDDVLSVLCFVLRDDGGLLELATSSMRHFKGRAKSVRPVGTMFAAEEVSK